MRGTDGKRTAQGHRGGKHEKSPTAEQPGGVAIGLSDERLATAAAADCQLRCDPGADLLEGMRVLHLQIQGTREFHAHHLELE